MNKVTKKKYVHLIKFNILYHVNSYIDAPLVERSNQKPKSEFLCRKIL